MMIKTFVDDVSRTELYWLYYQKPRTKQTWELTWQRNGIFQDDKKLDKKLEIQTNVKGVNTHQYRYSFVSSCIWVDSKLHCFSPSDNTWHDLQQTPWQLVQKFVPLVSYMPLGCFILIYNAL